MQKTIDLLATDPRTLHLASSLALADRQEGSRLVLVLDQFEEIFTLCADETPRRSFISNVVHAAAAPSGRTLT